MICSLYTDIKRLVVVGIFCEPTHHFRRRITVSNQVRVGPLCVYMAPVHGTPLTFLFLRIIEWHRVFGFLMAPRKFGRPGKFALLGCFLFQVLTLGTHAYATLINDDILSYSDNESWNLLICIPQFSKRKLLVSTVVR